MSDGRRPRRVSELVQALLSTLIGRELSDPNLSGLVVTKVEVPPDLSVAYVSVRLLVGDASASKRERAVRSLQGAAGKLRRLIGPALRLKRVPELRFSYDTAPDDRERVERLLAEIEDERQVAASEEPAAPAPEPAELPDSK